MVRRWLREDQLGRLGPMLPGKASDPGRTAEDNRVFIEAVPGVARTGVPWRDLPREFELWNGAYQRFARWSEKGVWHRIFAVLGRDADLEEVSLDSTIVRVHQHASGAAQKKALRRSVARAAD